VHPEGETSSENLKNKKKLKEGTPGKKERTGNEKELT